MFIFSTLFPIYCILCGHKNLSRHNLCADCEAQLPFLDTVCYQCALPLVNAQDIRCGICLKKQSNVDRIIAAFQYDMPIDYLISQFKFYGQLISGHILADLVVKRLKFIWKNDPWPEILLPVPLHPERLKLRGFNQALEIAKSVSKVLHIPIDYHACARIIDTPPQSSLNFKTRQKNVKNAFSIHWPKDQVPTSVAIIDDVVTTSATIEEIASTLKQSGVKTVYVWCIARRWRD